MQIIIVDKNIKDIYNFLKEEYHLKISKMSRDNIYLCNNSIRIQFYEDNDFFRGYRPDFIFVNLNKINIEYFHNVIKPCAINGEIVDLTDNYKIVLKEFLNGKNI